MFQPTLSYGESLAQGGNDGYQDIRDPVVPRPVTTGYDTNAKEGSSIAYRKLDIESGHFLLLAITNHKAFFSYTAEYRNSPIYKRRITWGNLLISVKNAEKRRTLIREPISFQCVTPSKFPTH
jgi:hypothetical protein